MDNALMIPVVEEWRRALVGASLGDVVQIDSRRFAFRFSVPPFHRLHVVLHPDLSTAFLAPRAPTPRTRTDLAGRFTERLGGRVVSALRKEPAERVVEIDFAGAGGPAGTVILELIGKASNLLLLDPSRRIDRFAHAHGGTFRRPREGEPYVPPPPRPGEGDAPPWGSRLFAREIAARAACGESVERARAEIEAKIAAAIWEPCLYTPAPPAEITESEDLPPASCFAAPFALALGEGLVRTRHDSANAAAAAHAEILLRRLLFRDLRGALGSLVRGEIERAERLVATLEKEAEAAAGAAEARRRGEMILASLSSAVKDGDQAELTDYFDPAMPRIRVPIDPRIDLRANAEALFRRARRMERGAAAIAERIARTRDRRARLGTFEERIAAAASTSSMESVEADLNRSGLVKAVRRPERRELGRKPSFMKVREYRTSDGLTVLVGRSGAENDALTFKVAAPNDFWLHAAGRSGAHVVVRNPRRLRDLPEAALREAAAIAAWFSRGDRHDEIDVHYTRRKEVRKGKGMSPGMVALLNFRTVRVRPGLPAGATEEPET